MKPAMSRARTSRSSIAGSKINSIAYRALRPIWRAVALPRSASFYREAHAAKCLQPRRSQSSLITASNPVNLVANLDRPGGNVTGVSQFSPTLERNRFELLRELMPKAELVGVFIASDRGIPELEVEIMRDGGTHR